MHGQLIAGDLEQLLVKLEQMQRPTAIAAGGAGSRAHSDIGWLFQGWLMREQAFAADLERLFGELEQMEPELTMVTGRGGQDVASVSLDETRVNRVILQARRDPNCTHSGARIT